MFLIAHRGNRVGRVTECENNPKYVMEALAEGFDAEIDVWWRAGSFWLGHDNPQYKITMEFLTVQSLWCHAKNLDAVEQLANQQSIHWFWHEADKVTITSKGYIWTLPGVSVPRSIVNQPSDIIRSFETNPLGICADDFKSLIRKQENK